MSETQEQRRAKQNRVALVASPRLHDLADQLEVLMSEMFAACLPYQPDRGADVMVLTFVTKQREHLRSVRVLLEAGLHRDALLIARTMLEGYGRLIWSFRKIPERTDRWFWFGAILDWRQIKKNTEKGIAADPDEVAGVKALIEKYGATYVRPYVRESREDADACPHCKEVYPVIRRDYCLGCDGLRREKRAPDFEEPEDPWGRDWVDTKIPAMFDEIKGKGWYDSVYRDSSEWIHWGPRALLSARMPVRWTAEERAEWCVEEFTQEDWSAAGRAMRVGVIAFLDTLTLLEHHFSLGKVDRLVELNRLMKDIEPNSLATAE